MLNFFLSTFVPALGVVLTAALLIYGVYYRWVDVPQKWLLTREALVALIVVAGLCDVWLGVRAYLSHTEKQTWQDSAAVRASRERFVLPQDFQYGELLIPAGSLINRTDPFDRGEPHRPPGPAWPGRRSFCTAGGGGWRAGDRLAGGAHAGGAGRQPAHRAGAPL